MTGVYLVVGFIVTWAVILIVVGIPLLILFEWVCGLIAMGRIRYLMRRYHKPMNPENWPWWKIAFVVYPKVAWRILWGDGYGQIGSIVVPRYPWQKLRRAPMWQ